MIFLKHQTLSCPLNCPMEKANVFPKRGQGGIFVAISKPEVRAFERMNFPKQQTIFLDLPVGNSAGDLVFKTVVVDPDSKALRKVTSTKQPTVTIKNTFFNAWNKFQTYSFKRWWKLCVSPWKDPEKVLSLKLTVCTWNVSQMLHVGNIYLHFPLNVVIFSPMYENIPYMEHLGRGGK